MRSLKRRSLNKSMDINIGMVRTFLGVAKTLLELVSLGRRFKSIVCIIFFSSFRWEFSFRFAVFNLGMLWRRFGGGNVGELPEFSRVGYL